MKSKVGAVVRYCNHNASFVGDLTVIGNAVVVVANEPKDGNFENLLTRPARQCTHRISEDYGPCIWNPRRGFFVVSVEACEEL